jgi:transposase
MCVDRKRVSQSFFGALNLRTGKGTTYRVDGNQNPEQTVFAVERLRRAYAGQKIAVVWDDAGSHTSEELMKWFDEGRQLEDVTLIRFPPYTPDHNPIERVWNRARQDIANIQRETADHTFSAFESFVRSGTFKYDFEHLAIPANESDLV